MDAWYLDTQGLHKSWWFYFSAWEDSRTWSTCWTTQGTIWIFWDGLTPRDLILSWDEPKTGHLQSLAAFQASLCPVVTSWSRTCDRCDLMTSCGFNDLMLHGLWSFSYWLHLGKSLNTLGHWYFWQLDWDQQVLFSSQMKEDVTKSLHNEKSVFFIEHQRAVFQSTNVASKRQWDHVQLWNKHTFGTPKIHQSIQISLPSVGAADATKILKTTCVGPCPLFWFVKNLEVRVSQMYFFSSSNYQMQKGNLSLGYEFCWCRKTWGRTLLESVDYFLKVDQQNRDIELGCSSWWGFSSAGRVEVSRDPWFFEDQKSTSTFQCNHIPSFFFGTGSLFEHQIDWNPAMSANNSNDLQLTVLPAGFSFVMTLSDSIVVIVAWVWWFAGPVPDLEVFTQFSYAFGKYR